MRFTMDNDKPEENQKQSDICMTSGDSLVSERSTSLFSGKFSHKNLWNPSNNCTRIGSPLSPSLTSSKLNFCGGSAQSPTHMVKPVLLRPSQLAATTADLQTQQEKKQIITTNNLFLNKGNDDSIDENEDGSGDGGSCISKEIVSNSSDKSDESGSKFTKPVRFVPLGMVSTPKDDSSSPTISAPAPLTTTSTNFVFGQNLHERIETEKTPDSSSSSSNHKAVTNGTSDMLFASVIQKDQKNDNSCNDNAERPSKSLSEAAREYEESRAVKRKYDEVAVVTGEEDEVNIIQLNCKLYAFDKPSASWLERGRGTLRLNDKESPGGVQSRVVMRTTGSLRVILNTKIWAGMAVERPSPKSVRLTALDNSGQIKVFLITGSQKETEQFHKSLTNRVEKQKNLNLVQSPSSSINQSPKHVTSEEKTL